MIGVKYKARQQQNTADKLASVHSFPLYIAEPSDEPDPLMPSSRGVGSAWFTVSSFIVFSFGSRTGYPGRSHLWETAT